MKIIIPLFIFFIFSNQLLAENIDSTVSIKISSIKDTIIVKKKRHSAAKAAVLSAILPGLGQTYNKKYWKIPIVYAGLVGLGYGFFATRSEYLTAREAYLSRVNDTFPSNDIPYRNLTTSQIQTIKNNYKSTMDLFSIITIVWYSLNIVDAAVDGHLFNYDVSNNLSLHIEPRMLYNQQQTFCSLSFTFSLKK